MVSAVLLALGLALGLVVLTFADSAKSHFTVARPLLKRLGFGATFFITEGFDPAPQGTSQFDSPA